MRLCLAKCSTGFDECKAVQELYGIQDGEVSEAEASCILDLETVKGDFGFILSLELRNTKP